MKKIKEIMKFKKRDEELTEEEISRRIYHAEMVVLNVVLAMTMIMLVLLAYTLISLVIESM